MAEQIQSFDRLNPFQSEIRFEVDKRKKIIARAISSGEISVEEGQPAPKHAVKLFNYKSHVELVTHLL